MRRKKKTKPSNIKGIAYYRHSEKDSQANTIATQQEHVKKYAAEHGIDIISEFIDGGQSNLFSEGGEDIKK